MALKVEDPCTFKPPLPESEGVRTPGPHRIAAIGTDAKLHQPHRDERLR